MRLWDRLLRLVGRKMAAFCIIEGICGISAWRHGITWPTAAVMIGAMLCLVAGVSGEKILSAMCGRSQGAVRLQAGDPGI